MWRKESTLPVTVSDAGDEQRHLTRCAVMATSVNYVFVVSTIRPGLRSLPAAFGGAFAVADPLDTAAKALPRTEPVSASAGAKAPIVVPPRGASARGIVSVSTSERSTARSHEKTAQLAPRRCSITDLPVVFCLCVATVSIRFEGVWALTGGRWSKKERPTEAPGIGSA